jgi:hypothetical protein
MKKIDRLFFNCEKSLSELKQADRDNVTLKYMNEEDRNDWAKGEFDALMFLIDKSARNLENAETQHNIDRHIRNVAIEKLSDKKKLKLIMSLIDKDLDLPF